jgi:hypothetical protein
MHEILQPLQSQAGSSDGGPIKGGGWTCRLLPRLAHPRRPISWRGTDAATPPCLGKDRKWAVRAPLQKTECGRVFGGQGSFN